MNQPNTKNKTTMKTSYIVGLGILAIVSAVSCKKDGSSPGTGSKPNGAGSNALVQGLNPNAGPFNTTDTINGSGFDTDPAKDSVWYNGVLATVQSATHNYLVALVPKRAGTGPVTVKVDTGRVITGLVFNYKFTAVVSTFAGNGTGGLVNGAGASAEFSLPSGLNGDAQGNLYVADAGNNAIRVINGVVNTNPGLTSTRAGTGTAGHTNGNIDSATFNSPTGVAVDAAGNIFVADSRNNSIRKISSNTVSTLAGGNRGVEYQDGTGSNAFFAGPTYLSLGSGDLIYVTDAGNDVIRTVNQSGSTTTVAGFPQIAGNVNGGLSVAQFGSMVGITVDGQGNVFVADASNNCIREVLTGASIVLTYAGATDGSSGHADGPADLSTFSFPFGIAFDKAGNLYVSDAGNNVIRVVTVDGLVNTIAGKAGTAGFADGNGTDALFNTPGGIFVDQLGNIFVADTKNNRIREIQME